MSKTKVKELEIIGVQERRELATIVKSKFNELISDVKENADSVNTEIVQKAAKQLGVAAINKQIKHLEDKIAFCKKQIEKLGFKESNYGNLSLMERYVGGESRVDPNTAAGRIYYNIAEARPDVKALQEERDNALQQIWLTPDRDAIKKIVGKRIDVKLISHNKK